MKARGRPPVESGAIRCRAGRRHRGLAVLALVAAAASLAAPPPASPQAMSFTVEGKITDHSKGKLTINSEQNIIFHVRYDEKTEIEGRDGKAATEKDLERGVKVKIEGDLEESGEIAANRIEIEEEAKPQKRSAVQAAGMDMEYSPAACAPERPVRRRLWAAGGLRRAGAAVAEVRETLGTAIY